MQRVDARREGTNKTIQNSFHSVSQGVPQGNLEAQRTVIGVPARPPLVTAAASCKGTLLSLWALLRVEVPLFSRTCRHVHVHVQRYTRVPIYTDTWRRTCRYA